jgi:uncharacterized membrane protein YjgN (DUF898 family)
MSDGTLASQGLEAADDLGDLLTRRSDLTLEFRGNARDYFRLWVVNFCLTLFTLGIFSAWAKVRRKRYFYSHTVLEGTPFEYLADPIPILKGRLIGAVLLALWYMGTHFSLTLLYVVLGVALLLLPWVMVRTAAFNARYSAYRNMTFEFSGTYGGAAVSLLGAWLIAVVTCGFGYPWAYTRVRRYFVYRTSFGGVQAAYTARGGHLLRPFLAVLGMMVLAGVLMALVFSAGVRPGQVLTPVLAGFYLLYGLAYGYPQARVAQVNWDHSSLGPIRFIARYRARDFIRLYVTNALAIVCSAGFLIPWAAVRMYRYRIENLHVEQSGGLEAFHGQAAPGVRATGAEVADLFDFDLSL